MLNSQESQLLGQIEVLQGRVEELEIQNKSLRKGFDTSKLVVNENPDKQDSVRYLFNYFAAALFPLTAGLFRKIYKRAYGLKKSS